MLLNGFKHVVDVRCVDWTGQYFFFFVGVRLLANNYIH